MSMQQATDPNAPAPSKFKRLMDWMQPFVGPENPPVNMALKGAGKVLETLTGPENPPVNLALQAMNRADPAGLMSMGNPLAMTAYHGSPHVFDKFSMSKIGTGEGAQAYGHGLYFTSEPKVAEGYRKNLLRRGAGLGGDLDSLQMLLSDQQRYLREFHAGNMDYLDAPKTQARIEELTRKIEEAKTRTGSFHSVDIPDDVMDFEKPLSEQPEAIRNAIKERGLAEQAMRRDWGGAAAPELIDEYLAFRKGGEFYDSLSEVVGGSPKASSALREAGIPGHSYKGESSGVRNFVMYDDAPIKPLGRWSSLEEFLRSEGATP
jgi:hypothetical protein